MSTKVEAIVKPTCFSFGECPHWDERTQTLLYVDMYGGSVHRFSPETGKHEMHKLGIFHFKIIQCDECNTQRL